MAFRSDPDYMVDQYEALRRQVLETGSAAGRGHGLALFLARGMPGWLVALAALAQSTDRPHCPSESQPSDCIPNLPCFLHSDFTSVLVDMVLALQAETTT